MEKSFPYELIEKIAGGQQTVYRAKDAAGRIVVVKAAPKASLTPDMRERFQREIEVASQFDHPNLLRVEASGETADMVFQVTEALEGADLARLLREKRVFTWDEKLSIMEQIAAALDYAHRRNVLHRDIKPANVFLENSGNVKLLDFGMARTQNSSLTMAGLSLGTLSYMSPEQIRGEQSTAVSDVFSAAMVFYELASGVHPFSGRDVGAVLSSILFQSPTPLKELTPDAPDGLDIILNRALEKEPTRRFGSAVELRQAVAVCTELFRAGGFQPIAGGGGGNLGATVVIKRPVRVQAAPAPEPKPAPPVRPAAPQKYCPSCTSPNQLDAAFCIGCGMPFKAASEPLNEGARKIPGWVLAVAALSALIVLALAAVRIFAE
jgi:serine/threonine-protein kinase